MTTAVTTRKDEAYTALGVVLDPELDEPITDLGFVRSLDVDEGTVHVHLRLPTSFCSPNFAYLMAGDSKDVLTALPWTEHVLVELDDHHDSDKINAGLAADAGYRGTFGHEAEEDLDELRATFRRKAYVAAMERSLMNIVVLTAALSSLNAGLYSTGRILRSMAMNGSAPEFTKKMTKGGVPFGGILLTCFITLFGVALNAIAPGEAFEIVLNMGPAEVCRSKPPAADCKA